jgi:hypothetical protein
MGKINLYPSFPKMDRISVRPTLWMETIQTVDMDQYVCDVVFHACIDVSIFSLSIFLQLSHRGCCWERT